MNGSCLCGGIRFEVSGLLIGGWGCSCSYCRKFSGTAFAFTVTALERNFRWTHGEHLLSRFEKIPGTGPRCFCSICGSPMPSDPQGGLVGLHAGSLDEELDVRLEVFLRELPTWASAIGVIPELDGDGLSEFHFELWQGLSADYNHALESKNSLAGDIEEFARIVQRLPEFDEWWQEYGSRVNDTVRGLFERARSPT